MDKADNRLDYINNFMQVFHEIDLDSHFWEKLKNKNNPFFEIYFKLENDSKSHNNGTPNYEILKSIVLLEFTSKREWCKVISNIFLELDNKKAYDILNKYNTSKGYLFKNFQEFQDEKNLSRDPKITVKKRPININNEKSTTYEMRRIPRGRCIIFDNVPQLVQLESKRFEHVFKELYFEVKPKTKLTIEQIDKELNEIYNDLLAQKSLRDGDLNKENAIILTFICHGINGNICGFEDDAVKNINEIIKLFSDIMIPKVFIFDCCRTIEKYKRETKNKSAKIVEIKNSFVIFACSEGFESNPGGDYTFFGQIFTHALAQFAIDLDLENIIKKTNNHLDILKETNDTNTGVTITGTECRTYSANRQLSFNV